MLSTYFFEVETIIKEVWQDIREGLVLFLKSKSFFQDMNSNSEDRSPFNKDLKETHQNKFNN
jgi:hypothetical protein